MILLNYLQNPNIIGIRKRDFDDSECHEKSFIYENGKTHEIQVPHKGAHQLINDIYKLTISNNLKHKNMKARQSKSDQVNVIENQEGKEERKEELIAETKCNCVKALIVDDEQFNISSMSLLLNSFGIGSDYAMNGAEALEKVFEKRRKQAEQMISCRC